MGTFPGVSLKAFPRPFLGNIKRGHKVGRLPAARGRVRVAVGRSSQYSVDMAGTRIHTMKGGESIV